ncbi:STM3941 family protein [Chryseobacterium gallinarum]|uniref:PH domain-containing protein n=1 Tax=Chryseobacterium gallinarum TaxID=1324352 RepID=A0ABX6KPH7_CHRGL|nr:STM3941 family protein [Chryseobacterium gallinarum]QIY90532.1 hypothetical protein FOB44_07580 [Chryseobacterium gallinarum]
MNTIEIKGSKTKLTLMLLAALIFVSLGLFFVTNPDKFISAIFKNAFFIRIVGIASILFFGLCLIFLTKSFFTKKINLIINEKGIIDNSSYVSVGMIFWDDITSIERIDVMSTKFLVIYVKDPEKYINIQSNIKKKLLQRNLKTYGSPISISSNTLTCSFNELEKIVLKYYNENKH